MLFYIGHCLLEIWAIAVIFLVLIIEIQILTWSKQMPHCRYVYQKGDLIV